MLSLPLLKKLIQIPALAGDETKILRFLRQRAKKRNLPVTYDARRWVIFGNPLAKKRCMAHCDEVGMRVIYAKDKTIHLEWIWRVIPSMYVGRDIEVYTASWIIPWIIIAKPLETTIESYHDLQLVLDDADYEKVQRWDTIRLKTVWIEREDMLFASVLDNRLWVAQLLSCIDYALEQWIDISGYARCFSTQEETRNEWWIRLLQKRKPEIMVIVDMLPRWLWDHLQTDMLQVLEKTPDWSRSEYFDWVLQTATHQKIILESDRMNRSEAVQFEVISWWKALHVFTPMANYHHGTYAVKKSFIEQTTQQITKIIFSV